MALGALTKRLLARALGRKDSAAELIAAVDQATAAVTANRALVSDADGAVAASAVTATELAVLGGVTAGTPTASKALVLNSSGRLTDLTIGASGQKLIIPSFAVAAGNANQCIVTITAKSADGSVSVVGNQLMIVWLADDATGKTITATAPSVSAGAGTKGAVLIELVEKKAWLVMLDGTLPATIGFDLLIEDASKTLYYVGAVPLGWGHRAISSKLETANYGSGE